MQGRNIALQRAVGFDGNKAAAGAQALALCLDDLCVFVIQLRDDHRDIGSEAVCGVVGHNRALIFRIGLFQCANLFFFHVNGAESKVHAVCNLLGICYGVLHNQSGY